MAGHVAHPSGVAAIIGSPAAYHPSAFVCTARDPWTPVRHANDASKTMIIHPGATNQGGNQWKCPTCGITFTSA